jgi:endonuclease G
VLSRSKKFARWVAWNIDGGQIKKYDRKGLDFAFDTRLPDDVQTGNDLYDHNRLDRGHIARRADLVWGTPAEAKQANKDSFYFTNITPQMDNFNQGMRGGLWGRLEDLIYEQVEVQDLRVSVIGGPIFTDDDTEYRGSQIPRNFYKIIAYYDADAQELRASAFVLEQRLAGLEAIDFSPFKQYQVTLEDIAGRTGLDFTTLRTADHFKQKVEAARRGRRAGAEGVAETRSEILLSSDITW